MAGHVTGGIDELLHAYPNSRAYVIETKLTRLLRFDGATMNVCEILNMDVEGSYGSVYVFRGLTSDCNLDGTADSCDRTDVGDFNGDATVDLSDYEMMEDCLAGPNASPGPAEDQCLFRCLVAFDADDDQDVDLGDVADFQRALTPSQ